VYKDGANYVTTDERHGFKRNRDWHKWAHNTIGARYGSGLTGTFADATLSVVQGVAYDEDIDFDTGGTKTTCQLWYRNAGLTAMRVELGLTTPYKATAGVIQYDNAGALADVDVSKFVNSYVYATGVAAYPIVVVVGQAQYTTLAGAEGASSPSILLGTAEWKLLYRVTYRNVAGTPTYIEATDLRFQSTGPATGIGSADHAGLTGRAAANQHPADAITNTPAGNIAATDVQGAIDELDATTPFSITITLQNGGAVLNTGEQYGAAYRVPVACTINSAHLVSGDDIAGSIVIDLWKNATWRPVDADSITAAAPPTLAAATESDDATLTGWTTALAAGDWLVPYVDSVTTTKYAILVLRCTPT
jgi:hypothetical protein